MPETLKLTNKILTLNNLVKIEESDNYIKYQHTNGKFFHLFKKKQEENSKYLQFFDENGSWDARDKNRVPYTPKLKNPDKEQILERKTKWAEIRKRMKPIIDSNYRRWVKANFYRISRSPYVS